MGCALQIHPRWAFIVALVFAGCAPQDGSGPSDSRWDAAPTPPVLVAAETATSATYGGRISLRHLVLLLSADPADAALRAAVQDVASMRCAAPLEGTRLVLCALDAMAPDAEAMVALVDALAAIPGVELATPDLIPELARATHHADPLLRWLVDPLSGGTWGLAHLGAPAAWNLVESTNRRGSAVRPRVFVADTGSAAPLPDLPLYGTASSSTSDHATEVASVIGARFADRRGMDGVAPWVELHAEAGLSLGQLLVHILQARDARVMNWSAGFDIRSYPCAQGPAGFVRCEPGTGLAPGHPGVACTAVPLALRSFALLLPSALRARRALSPLLVVAAAGNMGATGLPGPYATQADCNAHGLPTTAPAARWSTPFAYLLDAHPDLADMILVVGALDRDGQGGVERARFSNAQPRVWAPGANIVALDVAGNPSLLSGTSFAAPLVSGAAAFLLALEPDLTNAELQVLLADALFAPRLADGIGQTSLYRAVLGLDRVRPGRQPSYLDRLLDIDDGTEDGFQLAVLDDEGAVAAVDPVDRLGDGQLDLSDFRRLRDTYWAIATGFPPRYLALVTPKKDLNLDGVVEDPALEAWPLAAVAGRSRPSLDRAPILEDALNDFELFASRYRASGPDAWQPADLPALVTSADVIVRTGRVQRQWQASAIEVEIFAPSPQAPANVRPLQGHRLVGDDQELLVTAPSSSEGQARFRPICRGTPHPEWAVRVLPPMLPGDDLVVRIVPEEHPGCCAGGGLPRADGACPTDPGPNPQPDVCRQFAITQIQLFVPQMRRLSRITRGAVGTDDVAMCSSTETSEDLMNGTMQTFTSGPESCSPTVLEPLGATCAAGQYVAPGERRTYADENIEIEISGAGDPACFSPPMARSCDPVIMEREGRCEPIFAPYMGSCCKLAYRPALDVPPAGCTGNFALENTPTRLGPPEPDERPYIILLTDPFTGETLHRACCG